MSEVWSSLCWAAVGRGRSAGWGAGRKEDGQGRKAGGQQHRAIQGDEGTQVGSPLGDSP